MPTIDLRGQSAKTVKTVEQKAADAAEKQRIARQKIADRQTVRLFSREENERLKSSVNLRKAEERAQQKHLNELNKLDKSKQRAEEKRQRAEDKRLMDAAKAEKDKQKIEEREILKKQKLEFKAAEKSEKDKAAFEKKAIAKKQKDEQATLKKAEREKASLEKTAIREHQKAAKEELRKGLRVFPVLQKRTLAILAEQNKPMPGSSGGGKGGGRDTARNGGGPGDGGFWLGGYKGFNSEKFSEGFSPSVVGGIVGKILKGVIAVGAALVEAPLLPGQAIRGARNLAQPSIDFQKDAYGIARANQFSADKFSHYLYPGTGTTQGTQNMSLLGLTPETFMQKLNAYGMGMKSPEDAAQHGVMLGRQSLTAGFTGLPEGTVEAVGRQRAGYQGTNLSGTNTYLNSISGTLEDSFVKGLDRAKVLGSIEDAIDQVARSGSAGISTKAVLDLIARYQASGTPGGRTGESAVSAMAGESSFLKNTSSSPGGQMLAYSQMPKFGMLKTEKDIKNYIGDENWSSMSPKVRSLMVRDILGASRSGNTFAAFQIANEVGMQANPDRIADIVRPALKGNVPPFLANKAMGSVGLTTMQAYEREAGTGAKAPGGPGVQKSTFAMSPEEYRQILIANGYSLSDANRLVREGGWKNKNPLMMANEPTRYDPNNKGQQIIKPPLSAEDMQTTVGNMAVRANTAPGVGQIDNAAAQATLRGATYEFNTVLPLAVAGASAAFDDVAKKVIEFGNALSRAGGWKDTPGTERFRQQTGAASPNVVSPPPMMNPNHQ